MLQRVVGTIYIREKKKIKSTSVNRAGYSATRVIRCPVKPQRDSEGRMKPSGLGFARSLPKLSVGSSGSCEASMAARREVDERYRVKRG
jgi:hypothetical protein